MPRASLQIERDMEPFSGNVLSNRGDEMNTPVAGTGKSVRSQKKIRNRLYRRTPIKGSAWRRRHARKSLVDEDELVDESEME